MASPAHTSTDSTLGAGFGSWVRGQRESKGLVQRQVAAAAAMDQSHYAKIEAGRKFPKPAQAAAIARCLGLDEAEFGKRQKAAEIIALCGGDLALAAGATGLVQEQAAPYAVNNPVNNGVKRLRTKK